jgi:hypothetical protein
MKFSVGYQLADGAEPPFSDITEEYREAIAEVYFPWLGMASGRAPIGGRHGQIAPEARERFEYDLQAIRSQGLALNLLFNANCYGGEAMSRELRKKVVSVIERLQIGVHGVESVTTTSPAIAHMVKTDFPGIETRASVNMRIGTVQAMEYVAHLFDGYYVRRECNRDLEHLHALKAWADAEGKRLHLLRVRARPLPG